MCCLDLWCCIQIALKGLLALWYFRPVFNFSMWNATLMATFTSSSLCLKSKKIAKTIWVFIFLSNFLPSFFLFPTISKHIYNDNPRIVSDRVFSSLCALFVVPLCILMCILICFDFKGSCSIAITYKFIVFLSSQHWKIYSTVTQTKK